MTRPPGRPGDQPALRDLATAPMFWFGLVLIRQKPALLGMLIGVLFAVPASSALLNVVAKLAACSP